MFDFQSIKQKINHADRHHGNRAVLAYRIAGESHQQREYRTSKQSHNHQAGHFVLLVGLSEQGLRKHDRKHIRISESD